MLLSRMPYDVHLFTIVCYNCILVYDGSTFLASLCSFLVCCLFVFFQAEDGIRDAQESRGLGDVYKRQVWVWPSP